MDLRKSSVFLYNNKGSLVFHRSSTQLEILHHVYLVVEPTHLKDMLVKLDHFPRERGEIKKKKENTC